MKKIIALILTLTMVLTFASCGKDKAVDINNLDTPAITVNGEAVLDSVLNYYITVNALEYVSYYANSIDGELATIQDVEEYRTRIQEALKGFGWDKKAPNDEQGRTHSKIVMDTVKETLASRNGLLVELKNAGLKLTQADKDNIKTQFESSKEANAEGFKKFIELYGIKDENAYLSLMEEEQLLGLAKTELNANLEKYFKDTAELEKYKRDDLVNVKHILIMNDSEKGDALTVATEVYNKIKNGADFDEMMAQYQEDTGSGIYTFGYGEMVEAFEKKSFELEINELSEPVKTEYGYHVILRIPGYAELVAKAEAEAETVTNNAFENYVININILDYLA